MNLDAESREPDAPRLDLWKLPQVLRVEVARVRYRKPLQRYTGPNTLVEYPEAVEIRVQTSERFIARALAPVLYIGNTMVPDFEQEDDNYYRFIALNPERLRTGAAISLGWPEANAPRVKTDYRFKIEREETR